MLRGFPLSKLAMEDISHPNATCFSTALQVSAEKKLSHGLMLNCFYVFSKTFLAVPVQDQGLAGAQDYIVLRAQHDHASAELQLSMADRAHQGQERDSQRFDCEDGGSKRLGIMPYANWPDSIPTLRASGLRIFWFAESSDLPEWLCMDSGSE